MTDDAKTEPTAHPFGDRCQHGVQFLNQCEECPGGWQPTIDEVLAEQAQEREALAELIVAAAQPKHQSTKGRGPWRVLSQSGRHEDAVCAHRFELIADLCAIRRASRGRRETGVFYTVRRAES